MDPYDNWHKMSSFLFKASVSAVCFSISRGGIKLRCMQWGGTRISALSDGAGQRGSSGKIEDTSLCRLLLTLTDRWTPHLPTLEAPVFMVLIKGPTDGRPVEIGCFHPVEMYNQEKVMTSNLSIRVFGHDLYLCPGAPFFFSPVSTKY